MSEKVPYRKSSSATEVPHEKARRHSGVLKFITGTAAAAIAVISGDGKAKAESIPFDDAVNAISAPGTNDPLGAQIIPGLHPHRFKLTFSDVEPVSFRNTIYAGEFDLRDSQDGDGIEIRRLGPVVAIPNTENAGTYLEIDRGDGCVTPIWANHFEIHDGAETKWTTGASCEATVSAVHLSSIPGELKIVGGHFNVPAWIGIGRGDYDAWRTSRVPADFCSTIQGTIDAASFAGLTPDQAGLIDPEESTIADELTAPSAGNLATVTRISPEGAQLNFLYVRDSSTGRLLHLQRNADATWTVETVQNGQPEDSVGNIIWSMSKQKTPTGREVFILIPGVTRQGTSEPMLAALALRNIASNIFSEIGITMSQSYNEPDDDGDGRVNSSDGCIGRANPVAGIDLAGTSGQDEPDGKEDECQTNCGDAWPVVSPLAGLTETDFWECASELGFPHALTRGDGATLHYTGNLERDVDGAFLLQPSQRVRWMHTPAAQYQGPMLRNPMMRMKQGNSARFRILSTKYPDGQQNSTLTFSHYEYGSSQPAIRSFSWPTDWQESGGIGFGDTLESETGEFEIEVRNENFIPVPDGGTADAGEQPDGGVVPADGGSNPADAGIEPEDGGSAITDAGEQPDAQPNPEDAGYPIDGGDPIEDAGSGSDAGTGTSDAGGGLNPVDAGQNPQDSGPIDAGEQPDAQPNPEDAGQNPQQDGGQNTPDSGEPADGGIPMEDGGETPDAQPNPEDAGQNQQDGGPDVPDGGKEPDGGEIPDASAPTDSGSETPDANNLPDSGLSPDSDTPSADAGEQPDGGVMPADGGLHMEDGGNKVSAVGSGVSENNEGCGCGSNKTLNILPFALGIAMAIRAKVRKILKN